MGKFGWRHNLPMNKLVLVQVKAWHHIGDRPLPESVVTQLNTHICASSLTHMCVIMLLLVNSCIDLYSLKHANDRVCSAYSCFSTTRVKKHTKKETKGTKKRKRKGGGGGGDKKLLEFTVKELLLVCIKNYPNIAVKCVLKLCILNICTATFSLRLRVTWPSFH